MENNRLRNAIRLGWIPVLLAVLYVGWTFYSRHSDEADAQKRAAQKEAQAYRKTIQQAGGESLKINSFYVNPGVASKGSKILLCYSVVNATKVRIEPNGPEIHPSLSYCAEATPKSSTTYILTAEDDQGNSVSAEAKVTLN